MKNKNKKKIRKHEQEVENHIKEIVEEKNLSKEDIEAFFKAIKSFNKAKKSLEKSMNKTGFSLEFFRFDEARIGFGIKESFDTYLELEYTDYEIDLDEALDSLANIFEIKKIDPEDVRFSFNPYGHVGWFSSASC